MLSLDPWNSSCPIILLKVDVGSLFLEEFQLIEVLNIWAFLTSTDTVVPFGLIITWLPVLVEDMMVPPPKKLGNSTWGTLWKYFRPVESSRTCHASLRLKESGKHARRCAPCP